MIDKFHAIIDLCPNAKFLVKNNEVIWKDKKIKQPSDKEINEKIAELQSEFNAKQYQRDRKYPELGQQFDNLWHDINEGKLDKNGGFYKAIKAVKDAHPKPVSE